MLETDTNQVSLAFRESTARGFKDETTRCAKLTEQLQRLGLGMPTKFHIEWIYASQLGVPRFS